MSQRFTRPELATSYGTNPLGLSSMYRGFGCCVANTWPKVNISIRLRVSGWNSSGKVFQDCSGSTFPGAAAEWISASTPTATNFRGLCA